jgi:hypothetical protein
MDRRRTKTKGEDNLLVALLCAETFFSIPGVRHTAGGESLARLVALNRKENVQVRISDSIDSETGIAHCCRCVPIYVGP